MNLTRDPSLAPLSLVPDSELILRIKACRFRPATSARYRKFPHEYVVGGKAPENDRLIAAMRPWIQARGYDGDFFGHSYRYLNVDGFKYWICPPAGAPPDAIDQVVLNREPLPSP